MSSNQKAFVITNPMTSANRSLEVSLSKFLRVIKPIFNRVIVIGGNVKVESDLSDIELVSFDISRDENKIKRALSLLIIQFKMCSAINHMIQKNDPVFFWIGDKMFLPYHALQRIGAQINYFIMGNVAKEGERKAFSRYSAKLIRYMASHADYVCMEGKSVLDEWSGLTPHKTRIIHLYVDQIAMNPFEKRKNVIGMVCRLAAEKHVKESIRAMALIHKEFPEWKLEIFGSGCQYDECKKLIEDLNAGEYIQLLGWVEHDKIANKSIHWKYLLFPTDTEGLPNALLEMMGRGIPALTSPAGGVKDVVIDRINGFILPSCTVQSISTYLRFILSQNDKTYRDCSQKAFETIRDNYSQNAAVRNIKKISFCKS